MVQQLVVIENFESRKHLNFTCFTGTKIPKHPSLTFSYTDIKRLFLVFRYMILNFDRRFMLFLQ